MKGVSKMVIDKGGSRQVQAQEQIAELHHRDKNGALKLRQGAMPVSLDETMIMSRACRKPSSQSLQCVKKQLPNIP